MRNPDPWASPWPSKGAYIYIYIYKAKFPICLLLRGILDFIGVGKQIMIFQKRIRLGPDPLKRSPLSFALLRKLSKVTHGPLGAIRGLTRPLRIQPRRRERPKSGLTAPSGRPKIWNIIQNNFLRSENERGDLFKGSGPNLIRFWKKNNCFRPQKIQKVF